MSEPGVDDDAQRWVDAQSVVDGLPTATARQRSSYYRFVPLCVGGIAAVLGLVIAASIHGHLEIRLATTSTTRVLGWVFLGLGAVAEVGGIIWVLRRTSARPRSPVSPLASLTPRQRRRLRRAIRRDAAVPAAHQDVAAYQATVLTQQWPGLLIGIAGVMLAWSGVLDDDGVVPVWVSVPTVLGLVGVGPAVWDGHRAKIWLAAHQGGDLHRFH